jgi:hypothetical protein
MGQTGNLSIVEQILQKNGIKDLAHLVDQPALFRKVFKEIFIRMKDYLLSASEEELLTDVLNVIKNDLFILTRSLLDYPNIEDESMYNPANRIDEKYPLNALNIVVDAARRELIAAVGIKELSSPVRTRRIQNCRNKIIEAIDMINGFRP